MKTAWFECATGISGDMTLAALIDAGADPNQVRAAILSLGLPDVRLRIETVIKGGFRSLQVLVDHPEQHAHRGLPEIRNILNAAPALSDRQKQLALQMFQVIAEAEARVHGSTVEKVHFHEVGAIDSIVDIVGVAVAFDLLKIDRVVCSPVPPGRGFVKIDHGICPVPAPGTAEILRGVPLAQIPIDAELTTPTGAAIVKTLADAFGPMPAFTISDIGCGSGVKDFPGRANILRIFIGNASATSFSETDLVVLLETNLDDVTPEIIGYTRDRLMQSGALDVFTVAAQMKKNRPGVLLSTLCRPTDAARLESILFRETGTLGIRRLTVERAIRQRGPADVQTPWGTVAGKLAWNNAGESSFAPEFDACAQLAAASGVPLRDVYRAAEASWLAQQRLASAAKPETPAPGDHSHDHSHDHHHDHSHDHHHDHSHDHHHDHSHDHHHDHSHDHHSH